jgi:hypothetical protein
MVEIEKYPCNDANEATAKERYWFEKLNSSLNMSVPNRSRVEYNETNREEIRMQQRLYNADNKEVMATKRKKTFTCECGKISTWYYKTHHFKTKFHLQYMESVMLATIPIIPPLPEEL